MNTVKKIILLLLSAVVGCVALIVAFALDLSDGTAIGVMFVSGIASALAMGVFDLDEKADDESAGGLRVKRGKGYATAA